MLPMFPCLGSFLPRVLCCCLAGAPLGCAGTRATADGETTQRSRYVDSPLPPGPGGLYAEGVLARNAGDEDRALRLLARAADEGQLIMPNQVLGEMYRQRQQYDQSERFFQRMLDLDPQTPRNYFNLALTQELMQRFRDAAGTYSAGLNLSPEDAQGNLGIGRSYLALGDAIAAASGMKTGTRAATSSGKLLTPGSTNSR